jgi:CheY-like chemotaxis protein
VSNVNIRRTVENIGSATSIYTPIIEVIVNAIQAVESARRKEGRVAVHDADSRDVMMRVISGCTAEVIAVGSGSEALRAIGLLRPDVLVSDIGLPGEDGYELIRKILMLGEGGTTPAIALTAFSRLEDRTQAMLAGFRFI